MINENLKLPDKEYQIIYEDPAWTYDDKALAGNRGAGCKYNVMTLDELLSLPVNDIAAKDSVLFMWCTWPKLLDGTCMNVIRAHGFTPKTCAFNWIKYYNNRDLFMGMGNWTRANSEICILGTKGKPKRISAGVKQVIETIDQSIEKTGNHMPEIVQSKIEEHSRKPNIVRERIVELCGDIPRIELNAREQYEGWDVWGNETGKFIRKPKLKNIDEF